MNKNIVKKFSDFKARHSLSNEDITKMVTEYANSELDFASSYFSEKYNISKNIFYKARDYAVICCLIDEDICKKVKRKTIENYKTNNPKQTTNGPVMHFSELRVQRQEFLNTFSDNDIRDIAYKYAEGISLKNISFIYDIGEYGIKLLLRKGIIMLIVDKRTTEVISTMLGNKLNKILQIRERNKQKILDCIEKEIEFLDLQIENYDLYFRTVKEKPEKDVLKQRVKYLIERKQEVLRY